MFEGRQSVSPSDLRKTGMALPHDSSNSHTLEQSKPASAIRTPPRISSSIKHSASSLAASLISSLGGGSTRCRVTGDAAEAPCGPSRSNSCSVNSTCSATSATAISAAASHPASPTAAMMASAAALSKSPDTTASSWSGATCSPLALPAGGFASLTDPGTFTPSSPKHFSKLNPECSANKRSNSNLPLLPEHIFLDAGSDSTEEAEEGSGLLSSVPSNSGCQSKTPSGLLMRSGSSSLSNALVSNLLSASGTTPNNSNAGGSGHQGTEPRQKSHLNVMVDQNTEAVLQNESCSNSNCSKGNFEDFSTSTGSTNSNACINYKRCNTTGLIGVPVGVNSFEKGSFTGDPAQTRSSQKVKKDILSVFAKLSVSLMDGFGGSTSGEKSPKSQAADYKQQHGCLPSPAVSRQLTATTSNMFKPSISKLSEVAVAEVSSMVEDHTCSLPALPPGAVPSFLPNNNNSISAAANSTSALHLTRTLELQHEAEGHISNPTCSPATSTRRTKSLSTPSAQLQHSLHAQQELAVQPPKKLSLLPAHITEPTLLAASLRLPPNMQRPHWCMADFIIQKKLYEGYASTICKAFDRVSGGTVVLKLYHMNKLNTISSHQVAREVRLHTGLDHENIITLQAAFQEAGNVVLVQEYAGGGDLWSFIDANSGRLTERVTVSLVLQPFLRAIQYLHAAGIAHRDIKPENVLLTSNMVLKVADFGLAVNLREERAVTRVGTLDYMAPEVLHCPLKRHPEDNKERADLCYTQAVDAWAVGVLAFELLTGRAPFSAVGASDSAIEAAIQCNAPTFPGRMSEPAIEFISAALNKQPDKRPSILQMLHHPWIRSFQRSTSNGRAERRSSQDYGGAGKVLASLESQPSLPAVPQQEQQQAHLPLLPLRSVNKEGHAGDAFCGVAAGVYHTDDNGLTGYAVTGTDRK